MGFIFIPFNTDKQKSVVDMEGAVFIDNQENYLNNSNAGNKILFGKENFKNFYVRDWIELGGDEGAGVVAEAEVAGGGVWAGVVGEAFVEAVEGLGGDGAGEGRFLQF